MRIFIVLVIIYSTLSGTTLGSEWSHASPEHWKQSYSTCGGKAQSPVDISDNLKPFTPKYPINFHNYGFMEATLRNTGHSYQADIQAPLPPNIPGRPISPTMFAPKIAGGDLPGTYVLAQLHFHWGSSSTQGAEHTLHGCTPAGEMHFVHFDRNYGNLSEALNHPDGLAVIAVWLTPGIRPTQVQKNSTHSAESYFKDGNLTSGYTEEDHQAALWDWFKEMIPEEGLVPSTNSHSNYSEEQESNENEDVQLYLRQLLPFNTLSFFRYNGSLTTPGCNENVLWTVLAESVTVPASFLNALRTLRYDIESQTKMVDNFRPVQKLGNREILYSGNVSSYPGPCSKPCGNYLPRLQVKQEGQTCWASPNQYGVDLGKESSKLLKTPPLKWTRENNCTTVGLLNDGSALKVVYSEKSPTWLLSGGGLNAHYQLAHVDVIGGSRHSLNNLEYPMEVQLVLFNTKYQTLSVALQQSDGLLVFSRFFEAPVAIQSAEDQKNSMNKILADVIDHAPNIPKQEYWSILSPDIPSLIGSMSEYYQYQGSDGTCKHKVIWMIMHNVGMVSQPQLDALNKLVKMDYNDKKEIIKLDSTKLTFRVNSEELFNSYKSFMSVSTSTESVPEVTGAGVQFLGNHFMWLYMCVFLITKSVNMFI